MDLRLPDMDGTEAARRLGEGARTAGIPVVALSSAPLAGAGDWFVAAGFAGYVEKPFSVREFPDLVRGYCSGGSGVSVHVPATRRTRWESRSEALATRWCCPACATRASTSRP